MLFSIYPLWATQVDDLCCALCLLQRRRELLLRSASCERRKRWASVENMPIILIFTYMRLQRSYCIVRHSRSRRRRPSTTIRYEINAVIDYSTYLLLRSYCAVRTRSPTVCTPTVPCPGALAERPQAWVCGEGAHQSPLSPRVFLFISSALYNLALPHEIDVPNSTRIFLGKARKYIHF